VKRATSAERDTPLSWRAQPQALGHHPSQNHECWRLAQATAHLLSIPGGASRSPDQRQSRRSPHCVNTAWARATSSCSPDASHQLPEHDRSWSQTFLREPRVIGSDMGIHCAAGDPIACRIRKSFVRLSSWEGSSFRLPGADSRPAGRSGAMTSLGAIKPSMADAEASVVEA
jgi:hypothetical protein